jgi:hypothetical protein
VSKNCKMCGTANGDELRFCAACGNPLEGAGEPLKREAPKPAAKLPAKTMMIGVAPQAAARPQPAPAQAPSAGPPMATISAPAQPAQPAAQPAAGKAPQRTVFGVPGVGAQASAPRPAEAPLAAPVPMAKPVSIQPKPAAPAAAQDKRTVLGLPAAGTDSIPPPAPKAEPAPSHPAPVAAVPHPETRPIEAVPSRPPPRPETRRLDPVEGAAGWDDDDDEPPKRRGSSGLLIVAIAAVSVLVIGAAALVYLLVLRGGGGPAPQLFPSADGRALTAVLTFKDAPLGATVQVQGQTVPVVGGQARFDLPREGLKVGENAVPIIYGAPGAAPEAMTVPIFVRYTASTDLQGLATAEPFFVVDFRIAEGIQLAINGQPVQAIGGGYALKVPLSQVTAAAGEQSGDALLHKIPFQITGGDGAVEQGQQIVSIPMTQLRVDRPAPNATVASETVTCAGAVDDGAVVTVNGAAVGVMAAGFRASVPLPAIGKHTVTIEARAPGKAPRTATLEVTRIQSFDAALEAWSADLDRGIDYPTLARDPNLVVGKKIALHGRVVNISTERGVTAFLLYVGEGCPAGAKCAVYVAFRGETDAGLQSMVDVYGKVRGTWDVQLEGGGRETMPAIDAEFVLRNDGAKASKKRR